MKRYELKHNLVKGFECNDAEQFNSCQAWLLYNGSSVVGIQSYETLVAVIQDGTLYELGVWSRTTSKQVSQISNRLRLPKVRLSEVLDKYNNVIGYADAEGVLFEL